MNLLFRSYIALFIISLLSLSVSAFDKDNEVWRPVTPAELAMTKPQVESDADAEAIFWEVQLDDKKRTKLYYNHYVRVKIFTERGRERFSKFDIPFSKGKKVEDVAARVIKPDGTITELQPSDIFEREIVRAGKLKIQAKSFAVPGIEPGVIVEYRYKETFKNESLNGERLIFQRDIPIQRAIYLIRPYNGKSIQLSSYNMPEVKFVKNENNFYIGTLTNLPLLKEEPHMPPEDEVRQWISLSYRSISSINPGWRRWGAVNGMVFDKMTEPSKKIKQKAKEVMADSVSKEEKLRHIYNFVQKNIKNLTFDSTFPEEQENKLEIKDADDVLKLGMGYSRHIDMLFASLARAAGFATGLLISGDRSENFFTPEKYPSPAYIHVAGVAVLIDDSYQYFNPGTPYLGHGQMVWYKEDTQAMIANENGHIWKKIPLSDHKTSSAKRIGKFELLEDGTLEGNVQIEYHGHQAISRRQIQFQDSPEKRKENIKKELNERISLAEISNIKIENFDNPAFPITYSFKVRVPNYAQKTGKRLFFQPGFFEYGANPVFSSESRKHDIYFAYPWSEEDTIDINLPKGFELENSETPSDITDASQVSYMKTRINVEKNTNALKYKRDFYFGNGGNVLFDVKYYAPIKILFDSFHKTDKHTLTLKLI